MSLMQLLTVGRSRRNVKDHPNRYKPAQENLLPKFGADKAPELKVVNGKPGAALELKKKRMI